MIDLSRLSSCYTTRKLCSSDVDLILALCRKNPLFYRHTAARPTKNEILRDLQITPPGIDPSHKHYFGFFEQEKLVAVMDLIDGYPNPETAYLGFFMMNSEDQGQGIGSAIIHETAEYLKATGKTAIRLAIDKGNPQAAHFWKKNGFEVIREADVNGWTKLVAEKAL